MDLEENPLNNDGEEEYIDDEFENEFIEQQIELDPAKVSLSQKKKQAPQEEKAVQPRMHNKLKYIQADHYIKKHQKITEKFSGDSMQKEMGANMSETSNPQESFNLTSSEYGDVAHRLDDSLKQLENVNTALSTKSNLINLRDKVDRTCEEITLRGNVLQFVEQKKSYITSNIVIDVYRLELTDLNPVRKAYLLLKYQKQKNLKVDVGGKYLIDKIKLIINKKGQIVLISTNLTVLIQYQMIRQESEDSYDVS